MKILSSFVSIFLWITPNEGKSLRKKAFEEGASTGHNPASLVLKYTKERISQEFRRYLEDPSYIQPKIKLTPLDQSLLNI